MKTVLCASNVSLRESLIRLIFLKLEFSNFSMNRRSVQACVCVWYFRRDSSTMCLVHYAGYLNTVLYLHA